MKTPSKIITGLSILGVTIASFILLSYFSFQSVKKESQNFILAKNQLAADQFKIAGLGKFKKIKVNEQENFAKIDNLFISHDAPVNFIEFLEREAANSKLTLSITPFLSPRGKDEVWASLNFELDLRGDVSRLMEFLEKLEKSPYLIRIINLNINKSSKNSFEANISLKAYSR